MLDRVVLLPDSFSQSHPWLTANREPVRPCALSTLGFRLTKEHQSRVAVDADTHQSRFGLSVLLKIVQARPRPLLDPLY